MSERAANRNQERSRHNNGPFVLHDHLVYGARARRLQGEAIATGVRWLWRRAREAFAGAGSGVPRERVPVVTVGRASVADAFRRDCRFMARLFRRFVLQPYLQRRRRRIAIARLAALDDRVLADIGLSRYEIEEAVDDMLAQDGSATRRQLHRPSPIDESERELRQAA